MSDLDTDPVDGRHARRERNRDAVLDAVLDLFHADTLIPSVEEVAKRSGLSLRSVYRYYEDLNALLHAAIERSMERALPLARIDGLGEGTLDERIEAMVEARLRLYEGIASSYRATLHHAVHHPPMAEALAVGRSGRFKQLEAQFAVELDALPKKQRQAVARAADMLIQFESIDALRTQVKLSVDDTKDVLSTGLTSILGT